MVEAWLAWACLIYGIVNNNPLVIVACAVFAVAAQISRIVDRMDGEK